MTKLIPIYCMMLQHQINYIIMGQWSTSFFFTAIFCLNWHTASPKTNLSRSWKSSYNRCPASGTLAINISRCMRQRARPFIANLFLSIGEMLYLSSITFSHLLTWSLVHERGSVKFKGQSVDRLHLTCMVTVPCLQHAQVEYVSKGDLSGALQGYWRQDAWKKFLSLRKLWRLQV